MRSKFWHLNAARHRDVLVPGSSKWILSQLLFASDATLAAGLRAHASVADSLGALNSFMDMVVDGCDGCDGCDGSPFRESPRPVVRPATPPHHSFALDTSTPQPRLDQSVMDTSTSPSRGMVVDHSDEQDQKEVKEDLKEVMRDLKEVKEDLKEVMRDLKEVKKDQNYVKKDPKEVKKDQKEVKKDRKHVTQDQKELETPLKSPESYSNASLGQVQGHSYSLIINETDLHGSDQPIHNVPPVSNPHKEVLESGSISASADEKHVLHNSKEKDSADNLILYNSKEKESTKNVISYKSKEKEFTNNLILHNSKEKDSADNVISYQSKEKEFTKNLISYKSNDKKSTEYLVSSYSNDKELAENPISYKSNEKELADNLLSSYSNDKDSTHNSPSDDTHLNASIASPTSENLHASYTTLMVPLNDLAPELLQAAGPRVDDSTHHTNSSPNHGPSPAEPLPPLSPTAFPARVPLSSPLPIPAISTHHHDDPDTSFVAISAAIRKSIAGRSAAALSHATPTVPRTASTAPIPASPTRRSPRGPPPSLSRKSPILKTPSRPSFFVPLPSREPIPIGSVLVKKRTRDLTTDLGAIGPRTNSLFHGPAFPPSGDTLSPVVIPAHVAGGASHRVARSPQKLPLRRSHATPSLMERDPCGPTTPANPASPVPRPVAVGAAPAVSTATFSADTSDIADWSLDHNSPLDAHARAPAATDTSCPTNTAGPTNPAVTPELKRPEPAPSLSVVSLPPVPVPVPATTTPAAKLDWADAPVLAPSPDSTHKASPPQLSLREQVLINRLTTPTSSSLAKHRASPPRPIPGLFKPGHAGSRNRFLTTALIPKSSNPHSPSMDTKSGQHPEKPGPAAKRALDHHGRVFGDFAKRPRLAAALAIDSDATPSRSKAHAAGPSKAGSLQTPRRDANPPRPDPLTQPPHDESKDHAPGLASPSVARRDSPNAPPRYTPTKAEHLPEINTDDENDAEHRVLKPWAKSPQLTRLAQDACRTNMDVVLGDMQPLDFDAIFPGPASRERWRQSPVPRKDKRQREMEEYAYARAMGFQ